MTRIGSDAFFGAGLASVAIPPKVESIGTGAFAGCPQLASITVSPLNASYQSLDGVLFDRSLQTLIQYPTARCGTYMVPEGVATLGEGSFSTSGLDHLLLPGTLVEIGQGAFGNCTHLTTLTLPASVTGIGSDAFAGATNLLGVYFLGNAPNAERLFPSRWPFPRSTLVGRGTEPTSRLRWM